MLFITHSKPARRAMTRVADGGRPLSKAERARLERDLAELLSAVDAVRMTLKAEKPRRRPK